MKKKAKKSAPAQKARVGRPLSPEPTPQQRQQVEVLAGLGMTQNEIAIVLDMGHRQLADTYKTELRRGGLKADATVLTNLYRMAIGNGPEAGKTAIFWAKVRRRWHEVQRVIHGYDPEIVADFVKRVTSLLRRELPECCPTCKTKLDLPKKIAAQLLAISHQMAEQLPPSEIVPMPKPETAETE